MKILKKLNFGRIIAGAFTHMAVVFEAKKSFLPNSEFGKIIREFHNFLTLGSVCSDIPYLAYLRANNEEKSFNWENFMHYHRIRRIVRMQYTQLKKD